MSELLTSLHKGWTPYFQGSNVEWIESHVDLPHTYAIPGRVNLHRSRYMLEPLLALQDHNIRQVNGMAAIQTGKTTLAECYMLQLIANEAGTLLRLAQSDDMAKKMSETRLIPLLYKCKALKPLLPKDRFAITKQDIYFPHFNIHISAAKENALQSISAKYLIADECYLYKEGYISEAKGRTGAFSHTKKILLISQAGTDNDEWSKEFNKGIIHEYGWLCPHCNKEQVWQWSKSLGNDKWAGIVWDKNEKTKPDGKWNYLEAGKSARLVCEFCTHEITDNPQSRKYLNDTGRYIITVSNGDPTIKSYRWSAMANVDISFSSLVVQYLQAKDLFKATGIKTALEDFMQKQLAIPWKMQHSIPLTQILTEDYDTSAEYGDFKFLSIDVQNNATQFFYVIRAWCKNGESRLIKYGQAATWGELRQIQLDNKIKDQNVLVDSGAIATQVYKKCLEYGHVGLFKGKKVYFSWIALKGWDADSFPHPDGSKRIYSEESKGDPAAGKEGQGRLCPLYRWSNYSVKNILTHLRDGKGAKWVAINIDDEYTRQLNSEVLTKEIDKRSNKEKWRWIQRANTPNHFWDCECMQIVAAAMCGCIGNAISN